MSIIPARICGWHQVLNKFDNNPNLSKETDNNNNNNYNNNIVLINNSYSIDHA